MIEQHGVFCWFLFWIFLFIDHFVFFFYYCLNRSIFRRLCHLWLCNGIFRSILSLVFLIYLNRRILKGFCRLCLYSGIDRIILSLTFLILLWRSACLLLAWKATPLISAGIVASYISTIPLIGVVTDLQFIGLQFPAQGIYNHLLKAFSKLIFTFTKLYQYVVWQLVESHAIYKLVTRLLAVVNGFLFDIVLDQIQNLFFIVASQVISGHQFSKLKCGQCKSKLLKVRLAHVWRIKTDFCLLLLRSLRVFQLEFCWNRFRY